MDSVAVTPSGPVHKPCDCETAETMLLRRSEFCLENAKAFWMNEAFRERNLVSADYYLTQFKLVKANS